MRTRLRRFIDLAWFLITWGLFAAIACALLAGLYLYNRADEEIRALFESKVAEVYPDLAVTVNSAKLVERRGFEVRGVSISRMTKSNSRRELLFVDRISIACHPTLDDLLAGKIQVQSITVRGLRVQASRDDTEQWDILQLIRAPKLMLDPPPRIFVEGGTVEIIDSHRTPPALYAFRDLNMSLIPEIQPGVSRQSPLFRLDASFSGDHLQRSTIAGFVLPKERRFALRGNVPRVLISPELRQALPYELASAMEQLGSLRGGGTATFTVSHDAEPGSGWNFSADAKLLDGLVQDARLPEPLTDVQAEVHVDRQGVEVQHCSARYGSALLTLTSEPPSEPGAMTTVLKGSVRDLNLDTRFASLLPEKFQKTWQDLMPRGLIDASFRLTLVNDKWQPDVEVTCRDVSVEWRGFPVLCRTVQGPLRLQQGKVTFDLTATVQDQPVVLQGAINQPGPHWTGQVYVATKAPQVVSGALLAAIPEKAQPIVRDLGLQGRFTCEARYHRDQPTDRVARYIGLNLEQIDLRHAAFAYPVRDITGRVYLQDNVWRLESLRGVNDGATIVGDGLWQPTPTGGQLVLELRAAHVPLDEELRQALRPTMQCVWAQLRPRGTLDDLHVHLEYAKPKGLQVGLNFVQHRIAESNEQRDISLHPVSFPYRLEELTGEVSYANNLVDFRQVRGRHGETSVVASGRVQLEPDGSWVLSFQDLIVDRLAADRDLLAALPPTLSSALEKLQMTGRAHGRGAMTFVGHVDQRSPLSTSWNVGLNVDHAHFNCGIPLRDVAGTVVLQGASEQGGFYSRGNVQLDSLLVNDIHLTNVEGPIWFNAAEVRFGGWATSPSSGEPARRLTGRVFDGQLQADVQVFLDDAGRFRIHSDLTQGNVAAALRQFAPTTPPVQGLARAKVELEGTRAGTHSLKGRGTLQVTQANLYELPFILTLLKTMRSGSVDRSAFDTSNMVFRVEGEHAYLDRIDLVGDSITLKGVGEINTRREVNLDFYTILGRENAYVPAMRELFGMTNGRFLQIHVTGPIDNPTMVREVLPGLNETLEQLFPESTQPADLARQPDPTNGTRRKD